MLTEETIHHALSDWHTLGELAELLDVNEENVPRMVFRGRTVYRKKSSSVIRPQYIYRGELQ